MDSLVNDVWRMYASTLGVCVVRPSIPILYFGDSQKYRASPLKVITVALNPSRHEFPSGERFRRFRPAEDVNFDELNAAARAAYRASLDGYFRNWPYTTWFGWFEQVLQGMDASYYDGQKNTALHTDLCSPLATDPTWSRLGEQRLQLEPEGMALWHRLVDDLAPEVVVISVARHYRDHIAFAHGDTWQPLLTIPRADPARRPYQAWAQRSTLPSGKKVLLVFGPAAQQPFATLDKVARQRIGGAVREMLDAG